MSIQAFNSNISNYPENIVAKPKDAFLGAIPLGFNEVHDFWVENISPQGIEDAHLTAHLVVEEILNYCGEKINNIPHSVIGFCLDDSEIIKPNDRMVVTIIASFLPHNPPGSLIIQFNNKEDLLLAKLTYPELEVLKDGC